MTLPSKAPYFIEMDYFNMRSRQVFKILVLTVVLYLVIQIAWITQSCFQQQHQQWISDEHCDDVTLQSYVFPDVIPRDLIELDSRKIPNVFHYVFCSQKTNHSFLFENYLSVISAWRNFEPDVIEIHYKGKIIQDKYNTWLEDLKSIIPCLVVKEMPGYWKENDVCDISYARAILQDRGGVYVSNDVILTKHAAQLLNKEFSFLTDLDNNVKVIFSSRKHENITLMQAKNPFTVVPFTNIPNNETGLHKCVHEGLFNLTSSECVVLSTKYFPIDLFRTDSNLEEYLHSLYYVKTAVNTSLGISTVPEVCREILRIQNIVHYIWFHPMTLTFMMYLSVVSSLYVLKAERVYIHGDLRLNGEYWELIKSNPRVTLVYRELTTYIYGHRIKYTTHVSDVLRAEILSKYGGIYLDWDAMWLNPVDSILHSGHEVILNFDHMVASQSFPQQINLGVAIAAPRSRFILAWQKTLKNYRSDDFYYNALELPYKVYERNPNLVHIDTKLQVMCFRLKCHPIFKENHRDWTKHQDFNWKEVYAIHFTYPEPHEYGSEKYLFNSTGLFAEIGQYIIEKMKSNS
ncbi:hypothetical protein LOTGIDRAFT_166563 [Lottia gigantea]|uniref:Uncharacterized protein n=1 Tax=Lottia gigantea TaxID=225164 RepID=V3Z945_LOTGI|nr:hypothetical protein LOTGIDRAFT_166563 [Lottia gigantea]ESO87413.1 hypothetical protein LOTGIDRAFT_166563 [Lottia gigantea]